MLRPRHTVRNARLLADAAIQHVLDDPALLAVQISRRLPLQARRTVGRVLTLIGNAAPGGEGTAALGSVMAGDERAALAILERTPRSHSQIRGEVAVLSDRSDLLDEAAPSSTRARALWSEGDLSGAVGLLDHAGRGATAQARRLRNELTMLEAGFRLPNASVTTATVNLREGERLRILHLLTNSLPHTQSGYAVRTHHVLTALREHGIDGLTLTRTGYPVMVGKVFSSSEDFVDGIQYRRSLPGKLGTTPQARLEQEVAEALELVEELRPHVLHATTDYRNALVAQAVSAATGIPWILEVRGLMEQTWIAAHRSEETREIASRSEKVRRIIATETSLALEADAVVTLSRSMAKVLEERGVTREQITLVPNGVDSSLLDEDLTPARAREFIGADLPSDALAIGSVSALVDYEGFDVLLEAIALIRADVNLPSELRSRIWVVLVGDGVSAPALGNLARRLGIEDQVLMPGRVPRSQARYWVQSLDLVAVPRKDLEVSRTVTPQKPVEALALGRPVVVSDLPALRETIEDDTARSVGVLVPPDQPAALAAVILDLLQDPERRAKLAQEGRELAAARTWPAMMRRYDRTYRSVLRQAEKETSSGE